MRGSSVERGGFCMMSTSGGLNPRAVAGSPSVTKFTQSSWTGISASGSPRAAVRKILHIGKYKKRSNLLVDLRLEGFLLVSLCCNQ